MDYIPKEESLIEYPCHFPIKIVGVYSSAYRDNIISLIRTHVPDFDDTQIKERYSKNNKYLSLAVTVCVDNREQLDALYITLNACDEVSWVL